MSENNIFTTQLDQELSVLLRLNVDFVFNIIYNTVVEWVQQTYKDKSKYQAAYDKYIKLTRDAIRRNQYSRKKPHWLNTVFNRTNAYNRTKWENMTDGRSHLLAILSQMSPETAITFLSELTAAWCLSCPREDVGEYIKDKTISDANFANGLFSWLLRPFDYFW